MRKPPIGVTVIAALLAIAGAAGLIGDLLHLKSIAAEHFETVWIALVHVLAIVAATFMVLGHNWARWLAITWMAFHVAISFPSVQKIIGHSVFLILFIWLLLFRADARRFFRSEVPHA